MKATKKPYHSDRYCKCGRRLEYLKMMNSTKCLCGRLPPSLTKEEWEHLNMPVVRYTIHSIIRFSLLKAIQC